MYKSAKKTEGCDEAKIKPRASYKLAGIDNNIPFVSLIVPTFNEAKVIERKIANLRELQYPKDSLEVIIVDSGSIDGTVELARASLDGAQTNSVFPFKILVQEKRDGKASALNFCRPYCNGNIIVMTDADTLFEKQALALIVSKFEDPTVGAVSGKLIIRNSKDTTSTKFEKSYRDIFDIIRTGESNLDSTPIFNGPISAYRKDLMADLNPATIADDTELSLKIREKGWKAIYEPLACAYEYTPENFKSKNKQKIRRGQGILQSFLWHRHMIFDANYGIYGLIILPSEFFMHAISPLLIVFTILFGALNLLLTTGFALLFSILLAVSLILFVSIKITSKFFTKIEIFNPFGAFATFLGSQYTLLFSMFLLVSHKNNSKWEKIEDVRR